MENVNDREGIAAEVAEVVAENARRNAALAAAEGGYDPLRGTGCCGERVAAGDCMVPAAPLDRLGPDGYLRLDKNRRDRLRSHEDFEFWCARCVTIRDKATRRCRRFVPNTAQRRLIAVMEGQRTAGRPVRVILLKARQWGGSTLVLVYMAWMQIVRHENFNSVIVGHQHQNNRAIKQMLETLVSRYPREMVEPGSPAPRLCRCDTANVYRLEPGGCHVVLGSALSGDAARGYDLSMAHLSEVAFWKDSALHSPEDVVRTVSGTVPMLPDTVVVMESTANGTGHLFHTEWCRAVSGESDKAAVFVPWHEIAMYRRNDYDAAALWRSMDDYERGLWRDGLTLEMIAWYHDKRREYPSHSLMQAEYPTTDVEAFTSTDRCAFAMEDLERLRRGCRAPEATGEVVCDGGARAWRQARWVDSDKGLTRRWSVPRAGHRYVVAVDIGGLSGGSDWSVIAVLDDGTRRADGLPEVVAQWRGHAEHEALAWKAVRMAQYYNHARLVIESNTLDTHGTEGADGSLLLTALRRAYSNLYRRAGGAVGFHTNRQSKSRSIFLLKERVMLGSYIERDAMAVDEMASYQEVEAGTRWEAAKGRHDDIVMTRAIALSVIAEARGGRGASSDIDVLK